MPAARPRVLTRHPARIARPGSVQSGAHGPGARLQAVGRAPFHTFRRCSFWSDDRVECHGTDSENASYAGKMSNEPSAYPSADQDSSATTVGNAASIASCPKPCRASHRAVAGDSPRVAVIRIARSRSGSSSPSAACRSSSETPADRNSSSISASPDPRAARAAARERAKRPSSTMPARSRVSSASPAAHGAQACEHGLPRAITMDERPRRDVDRLRPAKLTAKGPEIASTELRADGKADAPCDLGGDRAPARAVELDDDVGAGRLGGQRGDARHDLRFRGHLFGRLGDLVRLRQRRRQESCRDDLILADLGLDRAEDALRHVRVLAQERGRVLPPLPKAFILEAEVGTRLLDDLALEAGVENRSLPGDPGAVDDVELGLLERRRDLVLDDLD